MREFTIGSKLKDGVSRLEWEVEVNKLNQEIKEKLDIDDGCRSLPGNPPYRIAEVDGIFYIWCDDHYVSFSSCCADSPFRPPTDGEVLCPCGNKTFNIEYGQWCCIGACTKCKVKFVVYDR